MQKIKSRIAAIAAIAFMAATATAQTFPNKPVKLVVPTTAGGQTDNFARALGLELGKIWSQPVIIENRPGANTIVGASYVAQSPADGYTILLANDPTLSSNQYLYAKLPYDPVKDFAPVINMVESVQVLVAESSFPAQTLGQFIDMAKAKPGFYNYGSWGEGSATHLDTEKFSQVAGIKLVHVPYKGAADTMVALMGKQIDVAFAGVSLSLPAVRSGKLKVLAYGGTKRSPQHPNVPTFAESGVPGFESKAWFGLVVPAATPRAVIEKIAQDTSAILKKPEFADRQITSVGYWLIDQGPDQFEAFLKKDRTSYASRIGALNLKLQ